MQSALLGATAEPSGARIFVMPGGLFPPGPGRAGRSGNESFARDADLLLGTRLAQRLGLSEVGLGLLEALADVGGRGGVAAGELLEGCNGVERALMEAVGAQAEILEGAGVGVGAGDGG